MARLGPEPHNWYWGVITGSLVIVTGNSSREVDWAGFSRIQISQSRCVELEHGVAVAWVAGSEEEAARQSFAHLDVVRDGPRPRRGCSARDPKAYSLRSREVVAIEVHHLGPRRDEVLDELRLRIRASVDLRQGSELGIRTEDEIDARAGPLERARSA